MDKEKIFKKGKMSTELSDDMYEILNTQYNHEIRNCLIYMTLSSFAEFKSYMGFAKYFAQNAADELKHAMEFHSYIIERFKKPTINKADMELEDVEPEDIYDCILLSIDVEQTTTENIQNIYEYAEEQEDKLTMLSIQDMLTEQIEEEATLDIIKEQIERDPKNETLLYEIDEHLEETNKQDLYDLFSSLAVDEADSEDDDDDDNDED